MTFSDAVGHALTIARQLHDADVTILDHNPKFPSGILGLFSKLVHHNYQIWHHEDMARMSDVTTIARAKNNIDPHNQERNNTIELIDEYYIKFQTGEGHPFNSETIGSIADRIIITELKILHTNDIPHLVERCETLKKQQKMLLQCGSELLSQMLSGDRQIFTFKQLKMYNDPETNPLFNK